MALRGLGILGLTAATCCCLMGCFQPGRMPSATLPPDIEPAQPRMLSHTPVSPSTAQAFEPTPADSFGLPSLAIDPWRPSVPPRQLDLDCDPPHCVVSGKRGEYPRRPSAAARPQRQPLEGDRLPLRHRQRKRHGRRRNRADFPLAAAAPRSARRGTTNTINTELELHSSATSSWGRRLPRKWPPSQRLVAVLRTRYGIEKSNVLRHSDIKATACPGKYFPMGDLTQRRMEPLLGDRTSASGLVPVAAQEGNRP